MSVKIPPRVNALLDAIESRPRRAVAVGLIVVVSVGLAWLPVGAVLAAAALTTLVVRGADRARIAGLKDQLAAAERDRDLYKASAHATAQDRDGLRSELASLMAASSETQRMPIIPLGGGQ